MSLGGTSSAGWKFVGVIASLFLFILGGLGQSPVLTAIGLIPLLAWFLRLRKVKRLDGELAKPLWSAAAADADALSNVPTAAPGA